MKRLFFLFTLSLISIGVFAQDDRLPEYPGGEKAFEEYFRSGLVFPQKSKSNSYSFSFKINENGRLDTYSIKELASDKTFENRIVERLKNMPKWEMGTTDTDYLDVNVTISKVSGNIIIDFNKTKVHLLPAISTTSVENTIDIAELKNHSIVEEIPSQKDEKPFVTVEQMPQFPGGQDEMQKFIAENLQHPEVAKNNGIQGRVVIRFVVDKDGSISNILVLRSLDPSCDEEAIRVIKLMPKWEPGKQNGKQVPVYYTLPIAFRL